MKSSAKKPSKGITRRDALKLSGLALGELGNGDSFVFDAWTGWCPSTLRWDTLLIKWTRYLSPIFTRITWATCRSSQC
jgi:hypothetical protein